MNDKNSTGYRWMERYNLEEMVSQAVDLAFSRKKETYNTMNNEATQMELINDNNEMSADAAEILRVIQESNEPVGRANIVARAGIPAHKWTLAIQELKEEGLVLQQGTRRGAKYTVS